MPIACLSGNRYTCSLTRKISAFFRILRTRRYEIGSKSMNVSSFFVTFAQNYNHCAEDTG